MIFRGLLICCALFLFAQLTFSNYVSGKQNDSLLIDSAYTLLNRSDDNRKNGNFKLSQHDWKKAKDFIVHHFKSGHSIYTNIWFTKALIHYSKHEFKESNRYLEKSYKLFQLNPSDSALLIKIYATFGSNYYYCHYYDSAEVYYKKALSISQKLQNRYTIIGSMRALANTYACKARFGRAMELYSKIDSLIPDYDDYKNGTMPIHLYIGKAYLYNRLNKNERAIAHYKKANRLINLSNIPKQRKSFLIASNYQNIANLYKKTFQYSKAISYYNKSLNYLLKQENKDHYRISNTFMDIGNLYKNVYNQPHEALKYYKKALKYKLTWENEPLGKLYCNMAEIYHQMNYNEESRLYLNKAEEDYIQRFGPKYYQLIYVYNTSARIYLEQGLMKLAWENIEKAGKLLSLLNLRKPGYWSSYYNRKSRYFRQTGDDEKALSYAHRAILPYSGSWQDTSYLSHPPLDQLDPRSGVYTSLKWKARLLEESYEKNGNMDHLKASLKSNQLAVQLLNRIRMNQTIQEDKLYSASSEAGLYSSLMEQCQRLYHLTGENQYREKAFEVSEQARFFILVSAMHHNHAKNLSHVPDSLLQREKEIETHLSQIREDLAYYRRLDTIPAGKIDSLEGALFSLNHDRDKLIARYEKAYPRYHKIKYDIDFPNIKEVQQHLNPDETLIEYFMADSLLFTFVILQNNYYLHTQTIDSGLTDDINKMRLQLHSADFINQDESTIDHFINPSYDLYGRLLKPIKEHLTKKLIIVPHGSLNYIPFDVLISKKSDERDYRKLSYLIRDYTIRYAYSAKLLRNAGVNGNHSSNGEMIAFAPSYDGNMLDHDSLRLRIGDLRGGYAPLPGAREEVREISRCFSGVSYTGNKATEKRFRDEAMDYRILHLAMHSHIDQEQPMFSKLLFSLDTLKQETKEDGLLNVYEIYNLPLKASLVTLSACNTGYGKLAKGEGIMSMVRGFIYAGCPDIVYSLWSVEDRSTAQLMSMFYQNLSKGLQVSQSLRQAKLAYLEQADPLNAHPYFWSGFLAMGHDNSLEMYYWVKRSLWMGGAIVIAGLLWGLYYWRKKKNG